jgi:hypothetical protein
MDRLKLHDKDRLSPRHSGGAFEPESSVIRDYIVPKALDPGLKPAGVTRVASCLYWTHEAFLRSNRFERFMVFHASGSAGVI